jgi:hypothetical protein
MAAAWWQRQCSSKLAFGDDIKTTQKNVDF